MKEINNSFDITIPILDAIVSEIGDSELSDGLFEQACDEFNMEDVDVMELMMESDKYDFIRLSRGWIVKII